MKAGHNYVEVRCISRLSTARRTCFFWVFFKSSRVRNSAYSPPSVRDNSVLHLVKTHPFPPVLFLIFLPALRSSFKKWRQRFPRLRCFSPDEARGFILYIYFLISSFTLFHFSLPSSFHLINKHTLQPTFIEQLGSSVPSHFFF